MINEESNIQVISEIETYILDIQTSDEEENDNTSILKSIDDILVALEPSNACILEVTKNRRIDKYIIDHLYSIVGSPRKILESEDKLGENETFEARIRGKLSVFSNLIAMIDDESGNFDINYLRNPMNKKSLDGILELLKYSEEDRNFITKK
jgi:hypothetical protein